MRKILVSLFALLLPTAASAQSTKAQLNTEVSTNFPDNTTGLITPSILRTTVNDFISSWQQAARVNEQTGTSYPFVVGDYGYLVTFSNASPVAVTLPQATGSFATWNTTACNKGAGAVTITPTTSTINGAATLVLQQKQCVTIVSDGTNYQVNQSGSVTSIGLSMPGVFTVTNSPITSSGTIAVTANGTSGGVPCFNSATTMASSGLLAANGVLYGGGAGVCPSATAAGATGTMLRGGAPPTWSTATFPSTATGTGTILRADGTNWVATTATYPATTTVSQLLYSSSGNVIAGLATVNGAMLNTDSSGVPSMTQNPTVGGIGIGTGSLNIKGNTSGTASITVQAAAGTPTLTLGTSSGTPAVTASSPLAITSATGNVTCATCVTSSGGGSISGTAPVAVSAAGVVSITGLAGGVLAGSSPAFTTTPVLGASGTLGTIGFGNATSGIITLNPVAGALGTVTLTMPAATDTLAVLAASQAFTNKSYNGLTLTSTTGTFTLTNGKTFAVAKSLTLDGTDGTTMTFPSVSATIPRVVASGAKALATGAISSAACTTAQTDTATGTLTTDAITASFNGDPTGITGYVPLTTGMLTIIPWPTADTVNFKVCNNTASSITPGAITINWRVVR